tara:strand:- start:113 stop:448 length:336 start_codon:yes stop_codon:yes gene_type:complete
MQLVITILKDYRLVEDLLLRYIDIDVTGATVIEGQGMGQLLGDVPILAGLRGLFPGSGKNSFVVLAAVDGSKVDACTSALEEVCGDMSIPGTGITFTIPIGSIRGLKDSIH